MNRENPISPFLKEDRLFGIRVNPGTVSSLSATILEQGKARQAGFVCLCNVHMLVTARGDRVFAAALERAFLIANDGMPLVWYLRQKGWTGIERVPGTALTLATLELAQESQVPVYFYGAFPQTLEKLLIHVRRDFPRLLIAGAEAPPQLPTHGQVDWATVRRLRDSQARIIFVGLGCPKQEYWMATHSPHLPAILLGVGAVFDFLGGTIPRCPVFLQDLGLEWLFRICREPRRLWRRYLETNSRFFFLLLKEIYRKR